MHNKSKPSLRRHVRLEHATKRNILKTHSSWIVHEMPFDFTGKKILVTGAGRGIGRGLVNALVEVGGEVYDLSLTKENLDSLVEELPDVQPLQVNFNKTIH